VARRIVFMSDMACKARTLRIDMEMYAGVGLRNLEYRPTFGLLANIYTHKIENWLSTEDESKMPRLAALLLVGHDGL